MSYEEEDTCMLYEEEERCLIEDDDHALPHARAGRPPVMSQLRLNGVLAWTGPLRRMGML